MSSILDDTNSREEDLMNFLEYSSLKIIKVAIPVVVTLLVDAFIVRFLEKTHGSVNLNRSLYQTMNYNSQNVPIGISVSLAIGIIIAIIVVTSILLALYFYGYIKIIMAWMMISVSLILSSYFILSLGKVPKNLNLPVDYISLFILISNLVIVGDLSIFWRAPKIFTQVFLVIISVLVAIVFLPIPDGTIWILLVLLVFYDACVVLCPHGLLNMLIKKSEEQNDALPALIYSTAAYRAPENAESSDYEPNNSSNDEFYDSFDNETQTGNNQTYRNTHNNNNNNNNMNHNSNNNNNNNNNFTGINRNNELNNHNNRNNRSRNVNNNRNRANHGNRNDENYNDDEDFNVTFENDDYNNNNNNLNDALNDNHLDEVRESFEADELEAVDINISPESDRNHHHRHHRRHKKDKDDGIRLGLGDFCFYGILVTRAARLGWDIVILVVFAVILGLSLTLLLLAYVKRALPALPFSLILGIIFFMIGAVSFRPFGLRMRNSMFAF